MNTQIEIMAPTVAPQGLLAHAALVTGSETVPALHETIKQMGVIHSMKMALVGLSGYSYFAARKIGGELSNAKAHVETLHGHVQTLTEANIALQVELERRATVSANASEKPAKKRSAKSSGARWSQADEQRLLELGAHRQGTSWEMISRSFAGRSAASVRSKYAAMTK